MTMIIQPTQNFYQNLAFKSVTSTPKFDKCFKVILIFEFEFWISPLSFLNPLVLFKASKRRDTLNRENYMVINFCTISRWPCYENIHEMCPVSFIGKCFEIIIKAYSKVSFIKTSIIQKQINFDLLRKSVDWFLYVPVCTESYFRIETK